MAHRGLGPKGKRLSTPRVKTGCLTCRIRRVKCDEGKPSCQRCLQTGRKCDGYDPTVVATLSASPPTSYSANSTPSSNSSSAVYKAAIRQPPPLPINITSYSIPFRVPGSQRDRQLLHYFCVRAGSEMSGYLGAESSPFWSRTVLRSSHTEPVVRQALVALSSLHLAHYAGDSSLALSPGAGRDAIDQEALQHYGKALRALQKRLGDGCAESKGGREQEQLAMICCVLFYSFESALGHSEGAMRHLENGLRILASARARQQPYGTGGGIKGGVGVDNGEDDIAEELARLDIQATMFDDDRKPSLNLVSAAEREAGITELQASSCESGGREDVGSGFRSVDAVQIALSRLQNWLFRFLDENLDYKGHPLEEIPPHVLQEKARLARDYARWSIMFDGFMQQRQYRQERGEGVSKDDGNGSSSLKLLGVHHRLTQLLLESNLPDDTTMFGSESNPDALALLDDIEDVIWSNGSRSDGHSDIPAASTGLQRSFSSETGVIAPLFLLAVKCADEKVTARAAGLLAACPRREGLYDTEVMTGVLRKLHAVREQSLQALGGLSEAEGSGEWGGKGERLGEKAKGKMQVSLEVLAEDMIDSRTGGFSTIGNNLKV